jgi:hypothetical protein
MRTLLRFLGSSGQTAKRIPDELDARRRETVERCRAVLAEIAANKVSSRALPLDLPKSIREAVEVWDMATEEPAGYAAQAARTASRLAG